MNAERAGVRAKPPLPGEDRPGLADVLRRSVSETAPWMAVLTAVAAAVRILYLTQPMRYDEAYTYLNYAQAPWFVVVTRYLDPNNHVFHTLLVHVFSLLSNAPEALRMPAFLAGVACVPVSMMVAGAAGGPLAACLAGAVVAVWSPHVEYSTNARGYTLIVLAALACWLGAAYLLRHRDRVGWGVLIVVASLGLWTVPTMLLPLGMLVAWLLAEYRRDTTEAAYQGTYLRHLLASGAMVGAVTLVLYAPILLVSGPGALFANRWIAPVGPLEWVRELPSRAVEVGSFLTRDLPWAGRGMLVAGVLLACLRGPDPRRRSRLAAVASVVVAVAAIAALRRFPPARVWLFLGALAIALSAVGWAELVARSSRRVRVSTVLLWGALTVVWPVVSLIRNDSVRRSPATGTLPDAEQVVILLRNGPRLDAVLSWTPTTAPLMYYAMRRDLDLGLFVQPGDSHPLGGCDAVVLQREQNQTVAQVLNGLGRSDLGGQRLTRGMELRTAIVGWSERCAPE